MNNVSKETKKKTDKRKRKENAVNIGTPKNVIKLSRGAFRNGQKVELSECCPLCLAYRNKYYSRIVLIPKVVSSYKKVVKS